MVTPIIVRHSQSKTAQRKTSATQLARTILSTTMEEFEEMDTENQSIDGDEANDKEESGGRDGDELRIADLSPKLLGAESIFTTMRPDGRLRDVLIIECYKINESDFNGTINY